MTIADILAEVDELKPNQYADESKIRWLSEIDGRIYNNIYKTHENDGSIVFNGYTENDMSTELIADDIYCDLYRHYLFAMIDYNNQESERYANSMLMFNNAYQEYASYYNRTHLPLTTKLILF